MNTLVKFFFLLFCLLPLVIYAADNTEQVSGVGQVAVNLMEPVGVLSDFVKTACFVIGGSFLFASIIKYFEHRRSPLMVTLSTVVFLAIAGLLLILLPFATLVVNNG